MLVPTYFFRKPSVVLERFSVRNISTRMFFRPHRATGRGGGGGGVLDLDLMHGRSRMTVDPHIPAMPGRSMSVFTDQAGITCTKREAP